MNETVDLVALGLVKEPPPGPPPPEPQRQFGGLGRLPEPSIWQKIETVLWDRGYRPGDFGCSGGGHIQEPYRPQTAGYVIEFRRDWSLPNPYACRFPAVNHAGAGYKQAVEAYMAALVLAGYRCELRPTKALSRKLLVWVFEEVKG